jgi:hypothetical protein
MRNLSKFTERPLKTNRAIAPPKFVATEKIRILGEPDPKHISTSFVERQNLSVR